MPPVACTATGGILEFMSQEFLQSWHPKAKNYTAAEAPAIPCYPLGALLQLSGIRHFQFFSLDVEGGELQVGYRPGGVCAPAYPPSERAPA